jgi:hypothetical protein
MEENKELTEAISSRFELTKTDSPTIDDLKRLLMERILDLLERNVERLLSILYRVDLNQKKLDEIFLNGTKEEIAEKISEAVIERQIQKIETRKYYKSRSSGQLE